MDAAASFAPEAPKEAHKEDGTMTDVQHPTDAENGEGEEKPQGEKTSETEALPALEGAESGGQAEGQGGEQLNGERQEEQQEEQQQEEHPQETIQGQGEQQEEESDIVTFGDDCIALVEHGLLADPQAWPFSVPVDHVALGLTDYPTIITNPQDLGSIKARLERGEYDSLEALHKDISQVWLNAKTYNRAGEPVYNMAVAMESLFDREWHKLMAAIEDAKLGEGVVVSVNEDKTSVLVRYENGVERWESLKDLDIEDESGQPVVAPAPQPQAQKPKPKPKAARPAASKVMNKNVAAASRSSARTPKRNTRYAEDAEETGSTASADGNRSPPPTAPPPPAEEAEGAGAGAEEEEDQSWMLTDDELLADNERVEKWVEQYGEVFWVKVPGYPHWPGRCAHLFEVAPGNMRSVPKEKVLVFFFGESSYAWVRPNQLVCNWAANKEKFAGNTKNKSLPGAVQVADTWLTTPNDARVIPMWVPPEAVKKAANKKLQQAKASAAAQKKRRASEADATAAAAAAKREPPAKRGRTTVDAADEDTSLKNCITCRTNHVANSMWRAPKPPKSHKRRYMCNACVDKATPILKSMFDSFKS